LALAAFLSLSLPARDLWFPDEPDLAEIAREMDARADFVQLYWCDEPFNDYPPGYFWLSVASTRLIGDSSFALRAPTGLAAVLLLAAIGVWARKRIGERAAWWSVLVLGTSFAFAWQAVNMGLDMALALWIGLAIVCGDLAGDAATWPRRVLWLTGTVASMALAALTKGPLGVLLPSAVVGLHVLVSREWKRVPVVIACAVLASIPFLLWCRELSAQSGSDSLWHFLYRQNVERFTTGWRHVKPWYYYALVLWSELAPWSLCLPVAVHAGWKAARAGARGQALALCWFGVLFVFFSVAVSKRSVYLLPAHAGAALVIGAGLAQCEAAAVAGSMRRWSVALWPFAALYLLVGMALPFARARLLLEWPEATGFGWSYFLLSGVLLAGGLAVALALRKRAPANAARRLGIATGCVLLLVFGSVLPGLDASISSKPAARWIASELAPGGGNKLGFYRAKDALPRQSPALKFYGGLDVAVVNEPLEIDAYWQHHESGMILAELQDVPKLRALSSTPLVGLRELRLGGHTFQAMRRAPDSVEAPAPR
jgi:4-amino-4-deoxy-L-arabinose transferase-like glycosyltransferase